MADEFLTSWKGEPVQQIDKDKPLYKGDRVIIRFKWFLSGGGTYLKAAQLSAIDKKLEGRSDFRLIGLYDEGVYLDVEVEVLQSPNAEDPMDPSSGITQASLVISTVVAISAAVIAAAIAYGLVSILHHSDYQRKADLVEKGVLSPSILQDKSSVGEVATGFKILSYTALIVAGGYILLRLFRR